MLGGLMSHICEMCNKASPTVLVNIYGTIKEICRECEFDYFRILMESESDLKRVKNLLDGKKSSIRDHLDMAVKLNIANVRRVYDAIMKAREK